MPITNLDQIALEKICTVALEQRYWLFGGNHHTIGGLGDLLSCGPERMEMYSHLTSTVIPSRFRTETRYSAWNHPGSDALLDWWMMFDSLRKKVVLWDGPPGFFMQSNRALFLLTDLTAQHLEDLREDLGPLFAPEEPWI